jgi:hypothetical protein
MIIGKRDKIVILFGNEEKIILNGNAGQKWRWWRWRR